MAVFVGSRTKFRTRFGQPLGRIMVHMVADTKQQLEEMAQRIGLSEEDRHETHYHVNGQYRYERAIALGAKPRFGMYWTRVVDRIQKRIAEGKWDA